MKSFVNCRFGKLIVLKEMMVWSERSNRNRKVFECKCDCGNIVTTRSDVSKLKLKSCGHCIDKNIIGQRFNKWIVLEDKGVIMHNGQNQRVYRCRCDCGIEKDMQAYAVKSGSIKSCGCYLQVNEFIGRQFNKLTILRDKGLASRGRQYKRMLECRCECGKIIDVEMHQVLRGHTKSCGCIKHNKPFKERDMVGKRFKKLIVVKENGFVRIGKHKKRKKLWLCECDCGKDISVTEHALLTGNTRSCGCMQSESQIASKFNDLTGKRFGRWLVIKLMKRFQKTILWECKCDCGTIRNVRGVGLVTGSSKSCGCLFLEKTTKHGLCKKGMPRNEYINFQRQDPIKRFRHQVSNLIRANFRKRGNKKDGKIFDYLPYTLNELKKHIESLWEPWMNWDNYGGYNGDTKKTWQLDHKKPQSSFTFASLNDKAFLECWALDNLQPLEKKENMSKGNRYTM